MRRKQNLDLAVQFLEKSIDSKTKGSRAFYTRVYYPLSGWSAPYPETTGYIITTFYKIAQRLPEYSRLTEKATRMADWIVSIQNADGSLPGGLYKGNSDNKSIFNTAQMIKGLVAAYEVTGDNKYLDSATRAALWIAESQNPDGSWTKYAYQGTFSPSYYTRVTWPILLVYQKTNNNKIKEAAIRGLDYITAKKLPNGFIADSGFKPNTYAFLHTIAYTLEGFIDSAIILDNEKYWQAGYDLSEKLLRQLELKGNLAGAYYEDMRGVNWYECITGHSQMAVTWNKIFLKNNDPRFVNAGSKILDIVCSRQTLVNPLFTKGGFTGSHPFWGRYIAFRQPNWAAKFFLDAVLLEDEAYAKIENTIQ